MDMHWCGLLNLNKPAGVTSRAVVDRVVGLVPRSKVGHAGTLDPLATGVLVIAVGPATRLIDFIQRMQKTYRTVIRLGARSDTLDANGRVTEVASPYRPQEAEVREVLAGQVGSIAQRPPEYSALKVRGERAYDLARAGKAVDLASRVVSIRRIDLLEYEWPRLELEIDCGGGTYIRAVARDVGEALGCGGIIEVLTRTRIGPFLLSQALDPEILSAATIRGKLQPALDAVATLPRVTLSAAQLEDVIQGRALVRGGQTSDVVPPGEVALVGPDGRLAAVAEHVAGSGRILPRRVLARS
jgi:tRNA pseudouridine55 synthase